MAVELVELGLNRQPPQFTQAVELASALTGFLSSALAVLSEIAIDDETLRTQAYRQMLARCCDRLREQPSQKELEKLQSECVDGSREFYAKSRQYWFDKESEFRQVIDMLMSAVSSLTEGNESFNSKVVASSDSIRQLVKLDDIRQLKAELAAEIEGLKMAVEEKRQKDQHSLVALSTKVTALQEKLQDVVQKAALDGLTGVANRESFDRELQRSVALREPEPSRFVLALLDLDDFKLVNDTHGHPVGDRVLVAAARVLAGNVREDDFVARYGGEEFAVILRNIALPEGEKRINEIIQAVSSMCFEYGKPPRQQLVEFTLSAGLTAFVPGDSAEEIISRADAALYAAKDRGKNRLEIKKKSRLRSLLG